MWSALAIGLYLFSSCALHDETLPSKLSTGGAITQIPSHQDTNQMSKADSVKNEAQKNTTYYQRTTNEVAPIDWEKVNKEIDERLRKPRPSDWPFPNFETGPGLPIPGYVDFYTMDNRFPLYLLCEYPVKEESYDPAKELGWFKEALEQIRRSGPTKFPSIKWIAVIVRNRAEHKGINTFEQSFKVGAIFKAGDVFDSSHDLSQLVASAEMDRHPFKYDTQQPTPGEQQRWMIVERYAATNRPTNTK